MDKGTKKTHTTKWIKEQRNVDNGTTKQQQNGSRNRETWIKEQKNNKMDQGTEKRG